MKRLWVLGAADPEMQVIERLLRGAGEVVCVATYGGEHRVQVGNAYVADGAITITSYEGVLWQDFDDEEVTLYLIECGLPPTAGPRVVLDHHRLGDPGYGRPPAEFLTASAIGQVVSEMARLGLLSRGWRLGPCDNRHPGAVVCTIEEWPAETGRPLVPEWMVAADYAPLADDEDPDPVLCWWSSVPADIVLCAAADHCLAAAYRGECPGVDPEALMSWRIETRAAHQGRPVAEVLADVVAAQERLRTAPIVQIGSVLTDDGCGDLEPCWVADLRGVEIPELPEAAVRAGRAFIATLRPGLDGRRKVVLQCATADHLAAWPEWAARHGIIDLYGGDPARGFAGGYES